MNELKLLFRLLIGLLLITATVIMSLEAIIPYVQSWQSMKEWQPTEATLLSVGDSEHKVTATYLYAVKDDVFQNNRVYLAPFEYDIGNYHYKMQLKLQGLIEKQETVTIWYNPYQPEQSILDKNLRWDLLILMTLSCLIFFLLGLFVCYQCLKFYNLKNRVVLENKSRHAKVEKNHFGFEENKVKSKPKNLDLKPWLFRKEWRNHRISSSSAKNFIFMWIITVFWTALSFPFILVLEEELQQQNYEILIGLLFLFSGLFMIKYTWGKTREWQRFGDVIFEMDPFPGSIGGHVGGKIVLNKERINDAKYNVELECIYSYVSGAGKHSTRLERLKWAEGGDARTIVTDGTQLKFRFSIPEYLPEADVKKSRQYNLWRLRVTSNLLETNLHREFITPVFKTQTKSTNIEHDISAEIDKTRKRKKLAYRQAIEHGNFSSTPLRRFFKYKDKGNHQLFYFPMFRNKLQTIIAIAFCYVAYSINKYNFTEEVINYSTLILSLPVAIIGLIASFAMIYLPFNNLRVILTESKIKVIRRLFIFPIRQDIIHKDDILKIRAKLSKIKGKGVNQIKKYKVVVYTRNNQKIKITEDVEGNDLAYQLKKFICKKLSIA